MAWCYEVSIEVRDILILIEKLDNLRSAPDVEPLRECWPRVRHESADLINEPVLGLPDGSIFVMIIQLSGHFRLAFRELFDLVLDLVQQPFLWISGEVRPVKL